MPRQRPTPLPHIWRGIFHLTARKLECRNAQSLPQGCLSPPLASLTSTQQGMSACRNDAVSDSHCVPHSGGQQCVDAAPTWLSSRSMLTLNTCPAVDGGRVNIAACSVGGGQQCLDDACPGAACAVACVRPGPREAAARARRNVTRLCRCLAREQVACRPLTPDHVGFICKRSCKAYAA